MSRIYLPIDFDETNEVDWKKNLSFAARLILKIGITRDEVINLISGMDKCFRKYLLERFDFLTEEKHNNLENIKKNQGRSPNAMSVKRVYDRLDIIPLETVFANLGKSILIKGHSISIKSKRYSCYARNGVTCIRCGIAGNYFAAERSIAQSTDKYHLNLYGIDSNVVERMITVDHRTPLSLGGPDTVENLQPMCLKCNGLKGDMPDEEFKKIPLVPTV